MDIQAIGEQCIEMHCSAMKKEHNYGDPECDFILRSVDGEVSLEDKPNKKPNAAERWDAWQKLQESFRLDDLMNLDWARRGDGALMLQDEWGWFAMVENGMGDIGAQSADRGDNDQIFDVYCEPVWLSWATARELERDNG